MLLVLQIAQYEAVAPEGQKLLLVLFWTVFRIMPSGLVVNLFCGAFLGIIILCSTIVNYFESLFRVTTM